MQVEELLGSHTPPIREIAERLRWLIRETVPEAEERVSWGWHAIGYAHPEAGYVGGIFPRDDVVKLCFKWGASLPDPAGILSGNQKRVRYVEIGDIAELPGRAIVDLLHAAIVFRLGER